MKIAWTPLMYQCLSLLLLLEMYQECEWVRQEKASISQTLKAVQEELSSAQINLVMNRARRLADEYERSVLEELQERYGYDDSDDEEWFEQTVNYNFQHYEIWKQAVRKKLTVTLTYDSSTSGITERLVDPYSSRVPYGEGYCHSRKEVRKFRFDRVIDIELTSKKFIKVEELHEKS